MARKFHVVPIRRPRMASSIVFGANVSQTKLRGRCRVGSRPEVRVVRDCDPKTVTSYVEQIWRSDADIGRLVASFESSDAQVALAEEKASEVSLDDQAPVVQLVNRIVGQALRDRASDIHVEPLDGSLRVRFRIDGQLVEAVALPSTAHKPLVSRLKIMSGMNIVETRAPQDGQFSTTVDGHPLDVRVATVATVFGEKVVMRLLDKSKSMVGLGELGMPRETYAQYSKIVHAPFGMVICAGPTGAGKTTTLYATLQEINDSGKNVTTIEDPVEYVFSGINQVQTNERAGLTFASGLKALLRQDPDVILVGEVRDADTARIAVQSALTGHMVLSSLHGNDSVAAVHRLLDMGIEAFLVASAVVAVVSQRLLRRICDNCKEPYEPTADELTVFRQHSGGSDKSTFYRGRGCSYCANTGYRERIGVYELLADHPRAASSDRRLGHHRGAPPSGRGPGHAHHAPRGDATGGGRHDHHPRSGQDALRHLTAPTRRPTSRFAVR
jgi:type IV pilus assembly protein PilB